MRIKNWSELYIYGYTIVSTGIETYFRKVEWQGLENIPKDKPVLFAPNHQNAFLDGAIIGYGLSKPVYFLGRSDIFEKPFSNKLLSAFNCLPIYRERDGTDYREKNVVAFEKFYEILGAGYPLVIFPEGGHGMYKQIRGPLKKGVFRIGVGAENRHNRTLDIHVIPVGIDYEKHSTMGGNLLTQFGKPIKILDYISDNEEEQEANYTKLIGMLQSEMHELLIDIKEMDYYDLIRNSLTYFKKGIAEAHEQKGSKLIDSFHSEKKAIVAMETLIKEDVATANKLKALEAEFTNKLKEHGIKAWLFRKKKHAVVLELMVMLLLLPIHLYGMLNNYLPYTIPHRFVNKKFEDPNFHASIKIIMGGFLFHVFWILQTVLVAFLTDHYIWLAYLLLLPLTGLFSYHYWIRLLKLRGKMSYRKLAKTKKEEYNALILMHAKLRAFAMRKVGSEY